MTAETEMPATVRDALAYLAQLDLVCRVREPWPGWHPTARRALLALTSGGNLLLGADRPPRGFRPADGAGLDGVAWRPGFVDLEPLGVGTLAGQPRVARLGDETVPAVGFSPGKDPLTSIGLLARELFRAGVALGLAAEADARAGTGDEEDLEEILPSAGETGAIAPGRRIAACLRQCQAAFEHYPEMAVLNNVLGNVEGRLLHGHIRREGFGDQAAGVTAGSPALATARTFALVRRERYGRLGRSLVAYERRMELYEGLSRYLELRVLGAIADQSGPRASEAHLAQDLQPEAARRMVSARLGLLTQINVRGWGASRRRFCHSGMGLCFLLEDAVPGWQGQVISEHASLDRVLESAVSFDGGRMDERLLELARQSCGYYERLEDERAWAHDALEHSREVLAGALGAPGTRITLDVSALEEKSVFYDSSTTERLGESVLVHTRPGVFTYGDGGTFVQCMGLPLVEDRRAKLFHVTVPGVNLAFSGDEQPLAATRGAEFTAGLDVELNGLRVRARRGTVRREANTVVIRLLG